MPIETVPESSLQYYLISFDVSGREREESDGKLSQKLLRTLATEPITDVFIFSHGWLGDVPAARRQYNKWLAAMAQQHDDLDRIQQARPEFKPLLIGLHWPSLPWGNEALENAAVSIAAPDSKTAAEQPNGSVNLLVDQYAERIADSETARQALRTIFTRASEDAAPPELPSEVQDAYAVLQQEADLIPQREGAAPGFDREVFDPDQIYEEAEFEEDGDVSFGDVNWNFDRVLAPLRTLSFWKMKDRARRFGEAGGTQLLAQLQQVAGDQVRFHLMGHSFGCIVVSASLAGKTANLLRPVNSVALVQGALSLWSYCSDIPSKPGCPGYFHHLIRDQRVKGPIITTKSVHDTAVGIMYPLGVTLPGQVDYAPGSFPTYGGLGAFGAQGPGLEIVKMSMLPANRRYSYENGKLYNLDATEFICDKTGGGLGGAHSDIAKPEVAHAFWEAVLAT